MDPLHRLPPLNALRAFEAVARHSSFSRAAEELHVTKAAVAQQVRALEQEIGARLVERNGRGLQLTESGAAGAATLAEGFALLAKAARAMREGEGRRFLIINSSASFAATWLVGRIGKFKARHPETDVLIDANPIDDALESGAADALIRWGAGEFPGLAATLLFKENVFPVCAPRNHRGRRSAPHARGSRPPHPPAPRLEPRARFLADLVRLAQGGRRAECRGHARRLLQQHGDDAARRRPGAGGGAHLVRDRRRRSRRRAPHRAVHDQRRDAVRLLFPLPAGRSRLAAHQGLARIPDAGGGAVGGGAGVRPRKRTKALAPRTRRRQDGLSGGTQKDGAE